MEITSIPASSSEKVFDAMKNNHVLKTLEVTEPIMSINSTPISGYKQWPKKKNHHSIPLSHANKHNGESTKWQPLTQRTTGVCDSTTTSKSSSDILGSAGPPREINNALYTSGGPTHNTDSARPCLASPNSQEGYKWDNRGMGKQVWARTLYHAQAMGTLNFMNTGELNSIMEHTFRRLPLYPTISYLPSPQSLTFIPWTPLAQEKGNQNPTELSALNTLSQTNQEMEKILEDFRKPIVDSYLLKKSLLKEFSETFSVAIIAHYLIEMKIFSLILKNMEEKDPSAVTVSPYRGQAQNPSLDKEKNLLNQPPLPLDLMKIII